MRSALAVPLLLGSTLAAAQPMDLYGSSPRSVAMGGVEAASIGTSAAAFYNPALLSRGEVSVGFNDAVPSMSITPTQASPTLTAQTPVDYAGLTFGAAVPMIGLLRDKVTLGLDVYVPLRHVFRSHIIDEGTAYFLRYDNAPERFQLALSLDVRPLSWLSIGAGAQVLSNYGGDADFETVLGMARPGGIVKRRLDSEVLGVFAPIVGLAVGPFKGFRVFAFWRGEMITTFDQPINVNLGTFGNLSVAVNGITSYSPHVLGVGASLSLLDDRLLIGVDVQYERWSDTPQLVPNIAIQLPQTLQDLGFNKQVLSRDITMGFSDIFIPRVGVEWAPLERMKVRAGYFLRPTPIPDQTGRTNFLDSTAHVLSVGGGWSFDDPLQMARSLTVDVAAQLTVLEPRSVVKDSTSSNPSYAFGGSQMVMNLAVKYAW